MSSTISFLLDRIKRRHRAWQFSHQDPLKQGRDMFTIEGVLISIAFNLSWGIFLAGYLKHLGISDALNGFIAVLPALVGIVQPLGAYTIGNVKEKKKLILILATIQRISYSTMYIIPLLLVSLGAKMATVVVLVLIYHILANFLNPGFINWIVSLAPGNIRGKYLSMRDIIMVIAIASANLGAGFLLDHFNKTGNPTMGFMVIGAVIMVLTVANLYSMSKIHEPEYPESSGNVNLKEVYLEPFKDKVFRRCMFVAMIWNFAFQLGIPYLNVYFVSFINLDFTFIMAVGFVATFERLLVLKFWWRLAEKKGWTVVSQTALILAGVLYFAHMFITRGNAWWLYTLLSLLVNIPWAVMMATLINLQLDHAPEDKRAAYIGANAAAQGLTGFAGGLLGAAFMGIMGRNTFLLLTAPQLLVMVTGLLIIGAGLYIKYYIRGNKADGNAVH